MLSFAVGLGIGTISGVFIGLIILSATAAYKITMLEKKIHIYEEVVEKLSIERKKTKKELNSGGYELRREYDRKTIK